MRHDWIFDVLTDLRAYAQTNGLPMLAAQAEAALGVARAEIAAQANGNGTPDTGSAPPDRKH